MREKTIEAKLVQAVRTKGGLAPKFTSPALMEYRTVWYSCPAAESPSLS